MSNEDIITDWDIAENLWSHAFTCAAQPARHPRGCRQPPRRCRPALPPQRSSAWLQADALPAPGPRPPARSDRLRIKPEEYAVMLAEPSHNTRAAREKAVELLFEKFKSPALFLAKNAVLASFAVGRQTSLVIDSGHNTTTGGPRRAAPRRAAPRCRWWWCRCVCAACLWRRRGGASMPVLQ
jgi:hypothetical protein